MQQRVTIRVPEELAQAMDLRARTSGATANAEYMKAIREHLRGDGEIVTVDCGGHAVQPWVTRDDIAAAQVSPAMIAMRAEPLGGFVLRGRVVTLDRQWFVDDDAFALVRSSVESSAAQLIAESQAWWGDAPAAYPIVIYGWPGPPPRLVTTREVRVGRDAVLDYQIHLDLGETQRAVRASVSPEAWFRILGEIAPGSRGSWPDSAALRGADLLAARAFRDVAIEAADAGAEELLVRSADTDLIRRICERAAVLRNGARTS